MDNLLIATWKRVFAYVDSHELLVQDKDAPFYGLTWNDDHLFVAARCWGNTDHDRLYIYDRCFKLLEVQDLPTAGQIHQILWSGGCVYLTDTLRDRIVRWNPVVGGVDGIWSVGQGDNRHHLNSVWVDKEGNLWVVGLHGHIWREGTLVDSYAGELHNFYVDGGVRYIGLSDQESLLVHNTETRSVQKVGLTEYVGVLHDPNDLRQCYTRGLAKSKDYLYVGVAAVKDERTERWSGSSAVVVFDDALDFVDVLRFEDTGGMHEVRVLGVDYAHNAIPW